MNKANSTDIFKLGVLAALVFIAAAPGRLSAQKDSEKATRISLGAVSGAAKSQVMVPLFLTPYPPEVPVGSISATIEYPSKGITFLKAEKSFLLDGVNGGFEAQAGKDPKDPGKSTIHIEVSTKGEPRKALREGLALTLLFRIEPDAPSGTTVNLALQQAAATNLDAPPNPIQPIARKDGSIEILKPESVPYTGCFFFSH
jgi:hypothetical protein